MLKSEAEFVLKYIFNYAKNDYAIINYDDVLLDSPSNYLLDKTKLNDIILILKNSGYITVKFNDLNRICVLVEQKGKDYIDSVSESDFKKEVKFENLFGICFFGAFVGSVLGSLIISFLIFIIGG